MVPSPNPKVSGISYIDFMSIAFTPKTRCLSFCSVSGFGYLGVMRAILVIMRLYIMKSPIQFTAYSRHCSQFAGRPYFYLSFPFYNCRISLAIHIFRFTLMIMLSNTLQENHSNMKIYNYDDFMSLFNILILNY